MRMKRIARKLLAGLLLVVMCLAITGALYEIIGRWRDTRRFPERGHLVQVGSIRLNIDCSGQGSPTVILESGSGGPSVDWLMVQMEVSKFMCVPTTVPDMVGATVTAGVGSSLDPRQADHC
jgi:hypothetical protein